MFTSNGCFVRIVYSMVMVADALRSLLFHWDAFSSKYGNIVCNVKKKKIEKKTTVVLSSLYCCNTG